MLIALKNASVYDPANGIKGKKKTLFIKDKKLVEKPEAGEKIDQSYDLKGKVVMSGAIDIHTHNGWRQNQSGTDDVARRQP